MVRWSLYESALILKNGLNRNSYKRRDKPSDEREVAELGDFAMDNQLPRLGYRGRYPATQPTVSKPSKIKNAFLAVVRDRWPEFIGFATTNDGGDFVIEYPSPHRSDGMVLWISADADLDEVIVGFGGGHSHGGPWDEPDAADYQFKSTIEFIDSILAEDVVGCTLTSGGSIGNLNSLKQQPYWCNVRSVRSWRGTHDEEFPLR